MRISDWISDVCFPIYGPDTNSEARIQFSFKYQLFASRRAEGLPRSWRDGLHFGYTQRMFWDLGAYSSPFRNIDFQPELFYLTPSTTLSNGISLRAQGGIRHESNGRDGDASRSITSIYIATRSAEHTSELQPPMRISYDVFCFIKKKVS